MLEQRIIDTLTILIVISKHQFVNNYQNVWHKIVILTDISNGYQSFGSILTMIALFRTIGLPN